MGAFQTGFQLGGDAFNSAVKAKLMEDQLAMEQAREARAAEEFNWRRDQQAREDTAFNRYNNLAGGIDTNTQKQLADTYGMNPAQVASALQAGGVEGLKSRVAGYDVPDASDLQSRPNLVRDDATGNISPVAGLQPRMSADQLSMVEPTRLAKEKAMEQLAIARRDVQGLRASQQAQLDLQKNDIASEVMKMKTSELDELAPQVSKSGYPLLYTGKSKNGYTFLKTENDGVTPIPGSEFKMTESQLRQMALAHKLGEAGFGTDALETLNKAHKDLGEHVARWNDTMTKVATVGNTATHYGNQDANAAAHTKMLGDVYGAKTLEGRIKETETQLGRKLTEDELLSLSGVTAKGKAGGGILARAVEQKKNDDGTYTAFDKGTGRALYNTYNGEEIPLGMTIDEYSTMKKLARENKVGLQVGETANGSLAVKYIGADGKPYDDVEAARYAKPTKPSAGAEASGGEPALTKPNSRMGTGERNPYVDATGRPTPNAPAGAPAVGPALVRQGAAAVENAVGTRAASTRYLQGKLDRHEALSSTERLRAKQLGLKVD
jgi:hypothetical protein